MAERTIALKTNAAPKEGKGSGTIYPGMLLKVNSTADTVSVHNASGQAAAPIFAIEDAMQGGDVSDAYTTGARVQFIHFQRGDEACVQLANGQTVVRGDKVESNGDGYLKKYTVSSGEPDYTNRVIGTALEGITGGATYASRQLQIVID